MIPAFFGIQPPLDFAAPLGPTASPRAGRGNDEPPPALGNSDKLASMPSAVTDWADVMERLMRGDRLALLEVSRLLSGFLRRWNAYDFRDEWDDLIQEAVLATASALAEGRIRDRAAVVGYLKSTARFKLADRLKRHLRCQEDDHLSWDDMVGDALEADAVGEPDDHAHADLEEALGQLDPVKRQAVLAVYAEGMTYEEAAARTGLPLGTLKRHLRDSLGHLRRTMLRRIGKRR
jgi:RNA polymerase sigma-70 factor (ECF subfamily)